MATYCIGDIHGAHGQLERLLRRLGPLAADDRLWFVGDLVNRGSDSLAVLRQVKALGERAITVLGNHDLSLLVKASGPQAAERVNPTLRPILEAPDCNALLEWLRYRPLIHRDTALGWTMVHAGIPAEWSVAEAQAHAAELEAALRGPDYAAFLAQLFGDTPQRWDSALTGIERLRYTANALTRQRFVTPDGSLDMDYKKTLAGAPSGLTPWFAQRDRAAAGERMVFGHWSALERVEWPEHDVWGIDTGAAWGGRLTALRLDTPTPQLIQVAAEDD